MRLISDCRSAIWDMKLWMVFALKGKDISVDDMTCTEGSLNSKHNTFSCKCQTETCSGMKSVLHSLVLYSSSHIHSSFSPAEQAAH